MRTFFSGILLILHLWVAGQESDTLLLTYDIDQTGLTAAHRELLDTFVYDFHEFDSLTLDISGSADYLGDVAYNQLVSDRRVKGVVAYMRTLHDGLVVSEESKGEINSHLEAELGLTGQTSDRSVLIILSPMHPKLREVTVQFTDDIQINTGESLVLKDLNFHPGRHRLLPASVPYLKELLEVLLAHPGVSFEIQGHICCLAERPTERDGKDIDTGEDKLSHNRAKNIYEFLVRNGVDSTKLTFRGYGFSQPLNFPETNQKERMQNRRVVLKVLGVQ